MRIRRGAAASASSMMAWVLRAPAAAIMARLRLNGLEDVSGHGYRSRALKDTQRPCCLVAPHVRDELLVIRICSAQDAVEHLASGAGQNLRLKCGPVIEMAGMDCDLPVGGVLGESAGDLTGCRPIVVSYNRYTFGQSDRDVQEAFEAQPTDIDDVDAVLDRQPAVRVAVGALDDQFVRRTLD